MSGRFAAAVAACGLVLLTWAAPAGAHGGTTETDVPASDYRTEITATDPELPEGLTVHVIDASTRLELRNRTGAEVIVLGYEGEPYLRIGPDGVYENLRSPATYINRSLEPNNDLPERADADAEPEWQRVSDGRAARWHDHRAHWMGSGRGGPDPIVVPAWSLPILYDGERIEVTGQITRVDGPSPTGAALAVVVIALALTASAIGSRRRLGAAVGSVGLAVCVIIDLVGRWTSTDDPIVVDSPLLFVPLGIVFALLLGVALDQQGVAQGVWMLGCAGLLAALLLGVAHLDWLDHSQLPSDLAPDTARASTVGILGFGIGLAGHALARELHTLRLAGRHDRSPLEARQ